MSSMELIFPLRIISKRFQSASPFLFLASSWVEPRVDWCQFDTEGVRIPPDREMLVHWLYKITLYVLLRDGRRAIFMCVLLNSESWCVTLFKRNAFVEGASHGRSPMGCFGIRDS